MRRREEVAASTATEPNKPGTRYNERPVLSSRGSRRSNSLEFGAGLPLRLSLAPSPPPRPSYVFPPSLLSSDCPSVSGAHHFSSWAPPCSSNLSLDPSLPPLYAPLLTSTNIEVGLALAAPRCEDG